MKEIVQGLPYSETTLHSVLLLALSVTALFPEALEAKFISNIKNIVRINAFPKGSTRPKIFKSNPA